MSNKTVIALYTTAKAIDVATGKFHTAGQAMQQEAHKLACSVLKHVGTNHDTRVVLKLLQAMPEMSRLNALKSWFEEYGPVKFEGDLCLHVPDKTTRLGEGMADPFWKHTTEPDYVAIVPEKALEKLIKQLATDSKKTGRDWTALTLALKTLKVEPGKPSPKQEGDKAARRTAIRAAKDAKPLPKAKRAPKAVKPAVELSLN